LETEVSLSIFYVFNNRYYEGVIISEEISAPFLHFERNYLMKKHNYLLKNYLFKLILASLFLSLAYVMPFLTGQIPEIGSKLCPMHIPVLLCGFLCGWPWGLAVGFIAPLFRSLTLGMPPLFPTALCMAFELAAYGAISGFMHKLLPPKKPYIYLSLLIAMIVGRLIWGAAMFAFLGLNGGSFTFSAFIAGAVTDAIPGIIVQIILIPVIVMTLDTPKILKFKE
jgi:LytS/YehU family sensor histidine kinase